MAFESLKFIAFSYMVLNLVDVPSIVYEIKEYCEIPTSPNLILLEIVGIKDPS